MTTSRTPLPDSVLTECVGLAVLAPSLHNSQPWRFRVRDGGVEVLADPHRQLHALDPDGRELAVSVGAALFTLRLAVRRRGRIPCVDLFPDPAEPDLVARVTPGRTAQVTPVVRELADAVPLRHTNRWPFAPVVVPADAIEDLTEAARHEGAVLEVAGAVSRNAILALSEEAERSLRSQGSYRAELNHWTSRRPGRRDGIPPSAIGPWDALERMPLRDFGLQAPRQIRSAERFEPHPTIVLLSTWGDSRREWITAGQALQRVLLVATRLRLASTPISQPVEIPAIRELLTDTGTGRWAQMVLRIGQGPPAAATPRRPLTDVLLP